MINNLKNIICFIACVITLTASCTKSDNSPTSDNNSINSTVVTGDFIITKFTDENLSEDKTADFDGYTFTFDKNGKITAVKNGVSTQGSYSEKPSHEGENAKLTLSFSNTPLSELNKNWQINLISKSAINLSDDDLSSGEVLEFSAQ